MKYYIEIAEFTISVTKAEFEYQLEKARHMRNYRPLHSDTNSFFVYDINNRIIDFVRFIEI